ncbi:glycoside hydrolase family 61 protein [Botryobasidium botryosum FD-172 SS1]|uniref:AA9 family lytic polysaccharide monooxygenase n=1 Tax=Botryobasidium botryosum (strain FD-172 SS1) TaxID=930990 RepID=A0A067LYP7_BOTB1|nr:glycoside hydrolase family 61 protein [Botryobasidium botryosum FD-172 SS1]
MKFTSAIASAILLATSASAHTIITELYVNGASQGLHNCLRLPSYDGPITDVNSGDLTCNGGPNPLNTVSKNACTVAAGSQVSVRWAHTLTSGSNDVIDASHKGPVMFYLAKVSNAVTSTPPTSGWFKIYEDGFNGSQWAVDKLIANGGKVSFTIPSCIPAGDYLLRGELALHSAGSYPGAQFYMECAQIKITGGGSKSPTTVNIPGAYKGSDPGVTFNLYAGAKTYTIPGPRPFTC